MRKAVFSCLLFGLLAACANPLEAQERFLYRERTWDKEVRTTIWEEMLPLGSIVHSAMNNGDIHQVRVDSSFATESYYFESPNRNTAYHVMRVGNKLLMQGTLKGWPLSRTIEIDSRPWYESIEWTLRRYVSASFSSVVFWIVNPYDANVHLMQARAEARETITVNDRAMEALRVRMSLAGIGSLLWSTTYWFHPVDGMFLRSEGVRGFLGTPVTVVELVDTIPAP